MNDFLYRMFKLTQSTRQLPTEDFASLCLGHHLERDPDLVEHLVTCLASRTDDPTERDTLDPWLAADSRGPTTCRTQVPAWSEGYARAGRADLVIGISGPVQGDIVIEAKVGDAVPTDDQLDRYRAAFPRALVVSLVEERVRERCPQPALSWDDVLRGLRVGKPKKSVEASREDLRRLLAEAKVGDLRLCLNRRLWSDARTFEARYPKMEPRLRDCLIAIGPNDEVRAAIKAGLADDDAQCEPTDGWGVGFWRTRRLSGTRVSGLGLSVAEGDIADEIIWKLEIRATGPLRKALKAETGAWWPIHSEEGWFTTDVHFSAGDRNLNKADFQAVVTNSRHALRDLHHRVPDGAWHARGKGSAPSAPRLSIPDIRKGVRSWTDTYRALDHAAREVLHRVVGPDGGERPYRRYKDTWRTSPGNLPGNLRLRAQVSADLSQLQFYWEQAPAGFVDAVWRAHTGSLAIESKDNGIALALSEDTWNAPETVDELARLLAAAVDGVR